MSKSPDSPAVRELAQRFARFGHAEPIFVEINGMAGDPRTRSFRLLGSYFCKHQYFLLDVARELAPTAHKEAEGKWELWRLSKGNAELLKRSFIPGRIGNIKTWWPEGD